MTNQPTNNEWIEKAFMKFCLLSEIKSNYAYNKCFKKAIEDNIPQSISREAVEKLINRYKRLEECEKDNIWWCALRCFIKDINSLLPSKDNDGE